MDFESRFFRLHWMNNEYDLSFTLLYVNAQTTTYSFHFYGLTPTLRQSLLSFDSHHVFIFISTLLRASSSFCRLTGYDHLILLPYTMSSLIYLSLPFCHHRQLFYIYQLPLQPWLPWARCNHHSCHQGPLRPRDAWLIPSTPLLPGSFLTFFLVAMMQPFYLCLQVEYHLIRPPWATAPFCQGHQCLLELRPCQPKLHDQEHCFHTSLWHPFHLPWGCPTRHGFTNRCALSNSEGQTSPGLPNSPDRPQDPYWLPALCLLWSITTQQHLTVIKMPRSLVLQHLSLIHVPVATPVADHPPLL